METLQHLMSFGEGPANILIVSHILDLPLKIRVLRLVPHGPVSNKRSESVTIIPNPTLKEEHDIILYISHS